MLDLLFDKTEHNSYFGKMNFGSKEKLKQLDDINTKNQIKYSEWTNEESEFFQHIYEQYHFHNIGLNNCNLLLFIN